MRKCLAIALTLSLWGCGKSVKVDAPSMTIDEPDRVLYEKALKLMEKHNYEVAQVTLQTLISTYQESDYFPKPSLLLGNPITGREAAKIWTRPRRHSRTSSFISATPISPTMRRCTWP